MSEMEKNIPELDRVYGKYLAQIRHKSPSREKAERSLAIWSAKYIERVTSADPMLPGEGTYGGILEAYAKREALKQYLEEL